MMRNTTPAWLALSLLVGSVNGHAILVSPPARSNQVGTGIKLQPFTDAKTLADAGCGGLPNRDPGVQIPQVAYLPGSTVTVTWQLTIPHPADVLDTGVRVALHTSPASSFALNILAGGLTGEIGYTPVSAGPIDAAANSLQSTTVQLPPGVTCDYCTLQWIWAARQDGGSYIGCADISITPNAPQLPNFALLPSEEGNILPGVPGAVFADAPPPPSNGIIPLPPGGGGANQGVREEAAGGIGAGSFFLGFLFGIAATLGYQWADKRGKFDQTKAKAREFYQQKVNPGAGSGPPSVKEARKAESLGLVSVETVAPAPPQKPTGMPPAMLPDGWTEEKDPASGRTYYYNNKNGDSSWTRPK